MKCPRCALVERDGPARCPGCGFSITDLDTVLGTPPARPGALDDGAGVLDDAARGQLVARLREHSERTHCEFVVVTRPHTAPVAPAELAFWLFNRWRLGEPHHRALLLLLAVREQRVEIEVGYALEDAANDLHTHELLTKQVVPHLRERDYATALAHAVDGLAALVKPAAPEAGR